MKNLVECLAEIRDYLEESCKCVDKATKSAKGVRSKKVLAKEEAQPKKPRILKAKKAPRTRLGRSSSGPSNTEIKAGWTALMGGG
jgi:hypothetical protein